jgi:thiamine biosynthesis lipoprotein
MKHLWLCVIASGLVMVAACQKNSFHQAEYFVFGTLVQVSLAEVDQAKAETAFTALQQAFQGMHRDWHSWEPGKLTTINQALAAGDWVVVDSDIIELIRHSQQMEDETQGKFNAAIGQLVSLWGFHTSDYPIQGPTPTASDITALIKLRPSANDIVIKGNRVHSNNPSMQLDFGGIAKGYAVDAASALLQQLDIKHAIINAGGDLRAFGMNHSKPWKVAIENPIGGVLGGIEIFEDEAVFTSGNYVRFLQTADRNRYSHILDPRSGWPAQSIMSATVIASSGWKADAAATALIVAGIDHWTEVATALKIDKVLVTDENGQVFVTPEMQKRLLASEETATIVVEL